jgi:hypothetical protein
VHRSHILVYKPQHDAQVTEFILSEHCSTCFRFHYIHLQKHKTTVTTVTGNHYTILLSAAIIEAQQQYGVMVTRHCSYSSFVLLKMGDSET